VEKRMSIDTAELVARVAQQQRNVRGAHVEAPRGRQKLQWQPEL